MPPSRALLGKPLEAGLEANALDSDRQHPVRAFWGPVSFARQHGSDLVVVHLGAGELEYTFSHLRALGEILY
jgi:hypothetical protein